MSTRSTRSPSRVQELGAGDEVARLPRRPVRGLEVLDVYLHARVVLVEEPALAERAVVVRVRLGPRLALDDHRLAGEPGPLADHDADEEHEEGPVEQEAPALATEPLVRREDRGPVRTAHAEQPATQHPPSARGSPAPGRRARRPRRSGASRPARGPARGGCGGSAGTPACAGATQATSETNRSVVDQREPPRPEHVEQAELLVDPRPERVIAERRGRSARRRPRPAARASPPRPRARGAGAGPGRCASSGAFATRGRRTGAGIRGSGGEGHPKMQILGRRARRPPGLRSAG